MEWNTSGDLIFLFSCSWLRKGLGCLYGWKKKLGKRGRRRRREDGGRGCILFGWAEFDPEKASTPHGLGRARCPYVKIE